MQQVRRLLVSVLTIAVLLAIPALVWAQGGQQVTHTVQAGENLYRISLQYGTTVAAIAQANNITNPSLIYVGQILIIPVPAPATTPTPVPTVVATGTVTPATPVPTAAATPTATPIPPSPTREIVHVVQPGENLFRISLQYNLLTSIVAAYNGITNPNLIYVGQKIRIPTGAAAVAVPTVIPATTAVTPAQTPTAVPLPTNTASNVGFAYGIQVYLPDQNMPQVMSQADALGVTWAKQEVDWSLYEPTQGAINWAPIDQMVDAMSATNLKILLTVAAAPAWARDSDQENGPPKDYQTYASFIGQLAQRYKGRVSAYEVWNEQNLRREWNTPKGISAASYVELLRLAFTAIKTADSSAIVITGGLAPTGFNDGVNAIDDRVYLRQMFAAGAGDYADAIGAHPSGWANPPDSTCCRNNRPAVPAWDDHPSFFFKQTLSDYREIMVQNGDSGTYIWATEFGWGSNDGLNVQPPPDFAFVTYTSMDEQASYTVRGFQLGRELGYVGPMFLYNLNFCQVVGVTGTQCLWSLLDPAGNPRAAYLALRDMQK
jgi:LysM repeat protein